MVILVIKESIYRRSKAGQGNVISDGQGQYDDDVGYCFHGF
jgi:hypothetical protein